MTIKQVPVSTALPSRVGLVAHLARLRQLRPLATLAVMVFHVIFSHADYTQVEALAAGVCGATTLNIFWTYFARSKRGLPVLEWVSFQLYIFFASPVFFEGLPARFTSFQTLSQNGSIFKALFAANIFLISLLIGWIFLKKNKFKWRKNDSISVSPIAVLGYGIFSLVVSFFLRRYELEIKAEWYTSVLNLLFSPTLAQILLLFEFQKNPRNKTQKSMMWAFTGLVIFQGVFSGRLDYALVPLVIVGMGLLVGGQRIPRWLIVVSLSMLLILHPAKHIYRELTGFRTTQFSVLTLGEMLDAWKYSIQQVLSGEAGAQESPNQRISSRLNNLSINAMVVDDVPEMVPYAFGKTWLAVPYSLVPRFFWPGKPNLTEITKDLFNVTFGLSTWQLAERTTGSYPIIADAFWNFGWIGIIFMGFFAGSYWKFIYLAWESTNRLMYTLPFFILIHSRAATAMPNLLIGLLQTAIVTIVVIKCLELTTIIVRNNSSYNTRF